MWPRDVEPRASAKAAPSGSWRAGMDDGCAWAPRDARARTRLDCPLTRATRPLNTPCKHSLTHAHTYTCICTYMYMYIYVHVCIHKYMYMCIYMYMYIYTHTKTQTHTYIPLSRVRVARALACGQDPGGKGTTRLHRFLCCLRRPGAREEDCRHRLLCLPRQRRPLSHPSASAAHSQRHVLPREEARCARSGWL